MKIRVNVLLNAGEGYKPGYCDFCPLCIKFTGYHPYSFEETCECAIGFTPKSCPVEIEENGNII